MLHRSRWLHSLVPKLAEELRDLLVTVQKAATAQRKGLSATGFRVSQNNGLSANQTVYHAHFHVVPFFGDGTPGTPAPKKAFAGRI